MYFPLLKNDSNNKTSYSFDFSGGLNLTQFFTLAQQNGLNVLLRPGPYICAEWENGGLPWWLLKYNGIQFRRYETKYSLFVLKKSKIKLLAI